MKRKTIIFIGRSGCGKGTQAKLIREYIEKNDNTSRGVLEIETGANFRDFINCDSFSSQLSKELHKDGKLQPEFLAVYIWSEIMVKNLKGEEHIIIDGTPRKPREAKVFDTAMKFYHRETPEVVFLNVSREWSFERLSQRGREDDKTTDDINKRLDWYDDEVAPTVEFFRNNSDYKFYDIKGEQSVENVFGEIIKKVFND